MLAPIMVATLPRCFTFFSLPRRALHGAPDRQLPPTRFMEFSIQPAITATCRESWLRRMIMGSVLYVADRGMPSFQTARLSVDVVCAGDSITGWNNFGVVSEWLYRTYPEFLQRLCDPLGLTVANGGIAGEVSANGLGQVRDYLDLFPNARYFVVGYGTNDLGMWSPVERTSPMIIENLDRMVRAIRDGGRLPILLNVPYANESMFPPEDRRGVARQP